MKTFVQAIKLAEQFTTKKEKFEALSGMTYADQSLTLIEYALNPYKQFNVKKWKTPKFKEYDHASYKLFIDMLDSLASRQHTGNSARDLVTEILSNYCEETAKYLSRVLMKNLDCGASETTFKKIYPDIDIPSFEVQLATKVDGKYNWQYPILIDSKIDGNRLIAIIKDKVVTYFSRSGKPSDHCNGLFDDELILIAEEYGSDIVLDGEVLGNSFQETMNSKGFDNDIAKSNLKYHVFDIMTLDEWQEQRSNYKQEYRTRLLERFFNKLDLKKVVKTKSKVVNNYAEVLEFYNKVLSLGKNDDDSLNGLGEGLIVKKLDAYYTFDRSKAWAKLKPVLDVDLTLIDLYEGFGKYEGTCGGLVLEGSDENGNFIKTRCGSGLNDETRDYFWKNRDRLIGKVIQLECQEICKAEDSEHSSLRFPIFIRIRDDK